MNKRFIRGTAIAAVGALALAGCSAAGGEAEAPEGGAAEQQTELTIGVFNGWPEGEAASFLWQAILEEKGYDVTITDVDVAPMYQGAANGDVDLFLDTWLPVTHADYWEDYGDQLEDLGAWYDNAKLTITVPSYMEDVNSIPDLADHVEDLNGRIVGIDPGAGLTRVTQEEAMPGYGLDGDFELVTSS
ncbi:MAG TPA: glycine betaine ABC transporter substrate-binding protein, partial [Agrococcus sp.]|nr:glycine betaine ABC transporter substrate-binding protein [Agrococcus sp.]